jgi:hypothetical protein
MIDIWDDIADDKLEVGMYVGVLVNNVIERGKIISIEDGFVRVKHNNKSVSAYQLGCFQFVRLSQVIWSRYEY